MSNIKLEAPFTAFRGKICKHSKIIFAQRGDTQYTSQSCNVTRTVTTRSEAWQRGDTSVVIQTKTVESYNAEKRL